MVQRSTASLLATTVIAVGLLAGCGSTGAPPFAPGAHLRASHGARALDAASSAAVAGVSALQAKLTTFTGTCAFWENDEHGNTQTNTVDVTWAAPEKLRADITASSDGMRNGASMVYLGGQTITAKKFFITQTFNVTDPKALSLRGYRIDQTDIKFMLGTITNPADTVVGGNTTNLYEVSGPGLLPNTTREAITLNPTTFVPQTIEFFNGNTSVYRLKLTSVKINPTIDPGVFQL